MGTGGRPTREDDGHAWALPSSVPVGSPISRSEIGRHTRGVGILECGDLVLGQCDVERGDGIGEMAGPGGADPGADTTGVLRTHASATWAVETPRSRLPDMPMSGRKRRTCLSPPRACLCWSFDRTTTSRPVVRCARTRDSVLPAAISTRPRSRTFKTSASAATKLIGPASTRGRP